jgi:polar amino acid transport system substrate-binding protein
LDSASLSKFSSYLFRCRFKPACYTRTIRQSVKVIVFEDGLETSPQHMPLSPDIISDPCPTGVLLAGINLSKFVLVTKVGTAGDLEGVAPALSYAVATGVPVKYVFFESPRELAEVANKGIWDIGLVGAEPQHAEIIALTSACAEIEALVPSGTPLKVIADVDSEGVRISVTALSAHSLWLEPKRPETLDGAYEPFAIGKSNTLAGLRPRLLSDLEKLPGARILDGRFTSVQRAIGTFLKEFGWFRLFAKICLRSEGIALNRSAHQAV